MGTAALIVQALEASAQLAPILQAGFNALRSDFSAADQATVDTAIAAAFAKLATDVARVEGEA